MSGAVIDPVVYAGAILICSVDNLMLYISPASSEEHFQWNMHTLHSYCNLGGKQLLRYVRTQKLLELS